MQMSAVVLANRAEVGPDGLLYVQGGGWEHFDVPELPWTLDGYVAGIVTFDAGEIGQSRLIRFSLSQAGQDLESSGSMTIKATRKRAPFVFRFTAVVSAEGEFVVEISDEQGPAGQVDSMIVLAIPED